MLSPDMYAEHVRPHDARLLREVGGGAIHFCGKGQHLVEKMIGPPEAKGLDFGAIHLMDAAWIHGVYRERKVSLHRVPPSRYGLVSGQTRREYPTGVVFVHQTEGLADACDVLRGYHRSMIP